MYKLYFVGMFLVVVLLQGCSSGKNAASADVNKITPDIGKFTDTRDGKTYKTTKIGTQTWMAENLNYNADGSVCYRDKIENCVKYGRLYDWETAMKVCPAGWHLPKNEEWDILINYVGHTGKLKKVNSWPSAYTLENTLGFMVLSGGFSVALVGNIICPECYLISRVIVGSSLLISTVLFLIPSEQVVDDDYGFSALPGGNAEPNAKFKKIDIHGAWWNATEKNSSNAHCKLIHFAQHEAISTNYNKSFLLSVRCVMD